MKFRPQLVVAIVLAGILVAAACGADEAVPSAGGVAAATPDVLATIAAQAKTVDRGTPTPTAVPAVAQEVVVEFAEAHGSISDEWDQFHADYDSWRAGLVACTASSVRSSLRGFAGRFAQITETARALPRPKVVRELADGLIQATEQEEEALRRLRDTWQPEEMMAVATPALPREDLQDEAAQSSSSHSPSTVSVFEQFEVARDSASGYRQAVEDVLSDRQARMTPAALASVSDFVATFNTIDPVWDEFHQRYDLLRSKEGQLTATETILRLGSLIDRFRNIVATIRQLPTTLATRPVAHNLARAAETEELALRRLRDTFQLVGEAVVIAQESTATAETPESSGEKQEMAGEAASPSQGNSESGDGVTFALIDPSLFEAFDAQLVQTNVSRLEARHALEDILKDGSKETQAQVDTFLTRYKPVLREWASFHSDYDEWRSTEGGCDRSKAFVTLTRFATAFSSIAAAARDLPPATVLRPLGEILVEAAEREEGALKELRGTWRPYDEAVYQNLDQERSTAGKLRRQVTTGIQDLLERYGISE